MLKKYFTIVLFACPYLLFSWGFFGHKKINQHAVFSLPPEMLLFYKQNITYISEHSIDPDKRRYAIKEEGPRHYIDIDHYGTYPYPNLPRSWDSAVAKFGEDSVQQFGIVPWHVQAMLGKLTQAFKANNYAKILKYSAELGHYISDAHVPLHASSNHNGQYTNQKGIHGFWESRVPELLANKSWDFFVGKAQYIKNPGEYIWARVLESALAADSVLSIEKELTKKFRADKKYSFEKRGAVDIKQYSSAFTRAFDAKLNGMVERRMRLSMLSTASFWYTAWVNAGQPNLNNLLGQKFNAADLKEIEDLETAWKNAPKIIGREEDH
jgi:hypothetical protein